MKVEITVALNKIIRTILSCRKKSQLEACRKMIENFISLYMPMEELEQTAYRDSLYELLTIKGEKLK